MLSICQVSLFLLNFKISQSRSECILIVNYSVNTNKIKLNLDKILFLQPTSMCLSPQINHCFHVFYTCVQVYIVLHMFCKYALYIICVYINYVSYCFVSWVLKYVGSIFMNCSSTHF